MTTANADLQNLFDTVSQANKRPLLSQEQFDLLLTGESPQTIAWFGKVANAAAAGNAEATEKFLVLHAAVRITDGLLSNGFPDITKSIAKRILDTHGTARVGNATRALRDGDPESKHEIRAWIDQAKAAAAAAASSQSAPPAEAAPSQAPAPSQAAQRFSQVPPPPGVRTSQVQSGSRPAQPSADVREFPQDRVRQTPSTQAPSTQTRDDPRTMRRDAPRQERNDRQERPQRHDSAPSTSGEQQYDQHACYGKDIAVQFQNLPTRDRTSNTVMLKIARAKGATCKQGVDWDGSILINLEPHEVQTCAAVLLGYGTKVRYAGHGQANDKWFELQETTDNWAGSIRLQVGQGDEKRSVNIGPTDVGEVSALFLRALSTQVRVAPSLYPMILRRAFDLYQKNLDSAAARKNASGGGGQGNGGQRQQGSGGHQQGQRRAHG